MSDVPVQICVFILLCCCASGAFAELSLPSIFNDGMVLQRGMDVPVWGTAAPQSDVIVCFKGQTVKTVSDEKGKFEVRLEPLEVSAGGGELVVESENDTVSLEDVVVGEVWLFSGQSNMGMGVKGSTTAEESIATADFPHIRFFQPKPGRKESWKWVRSTPSHAPGFSAVAFYYARALHRDLDVPVGMIVCAKGGSMIQSWISRQGFEGNPALREQIMDRYDSLAHPEKLAQLMGDKWEKQVNKSGGDEDKAVKKMMRPRNSGPGRNFQDYGMARIAPYAIRGFGWYQGESNAWGFDVAERYRDELQLLIEDWRRHWGGQKRPFLVVQLPHYPQKKRPEKPFFLNPWCIVMEAQWSIQNVVSNVYTAVTVDLGEHEDIHPNDKAPVGERLDRLARKYVYGEDIVARGPVFESMKVQDGQARLSFKHVDGGLEARTVPGTPAQKGRLEGFLIAGKARRFLRADARIENDQVICSNEDIEKPVAVRYAMHGSCVFNLYNRAGLPAAPFRTDEWSTDIPQKKEKVAVAVRARTAPEIDGHLTDEVWQKATPQNSLQQFHTYHYAEYQTLARFVWDEQALYVGFECMQPADKWTVEAQKRDDEKIWSDDNVQLFLDVNHDQRSYLRIAINPDGVLADGEGFNDWQAEGKLYNQKLLTHYRDFSLDKDVECEVATAKQDDKWTVEMAIPWSSLGRKNPPDEPMGLQFTRTCAATGERSEWATTGRDYNTGAMLPYTWTKGKRLFHGVGRFGVLRLNNE